MKFVVDASLRGLARWLRFSGLDALEMRLAPLGGRLPPPEEGAYLLTRQTSLARLGRPDLLIIAANTPQAQLKEVLERLGISRVQLDPLSRCSRCNRPLAPLPREAAQGLVPEHVFIHQPEFYQCPGCGRIFWPGTHVARITRRLDAALGKGPSGS